MTTPLSGAIDSAQKEGLPSRLWRDHAFSVILLLCLSCAFLFVLLDLYVNWLRWSDSRAIRRMFNITREDGLASLFSVVLTLMVALVIWLIYALRRRTAEGVNVIGWLVLALFFTYMGIDDGAMVHERIGTVFKKANNTLELPSYGWQMVVAPFFILMGAFMFWFLWRQSRAMIRRDWLIMALGCLALAMVLDFIEGMDDAYQALESAMSWPVPTISHFSKSLEEFLEMAGMSFMLILFLNYLAALTEELEVRIVNRRIYLRKI